MGSEEGEGGGVVRGGGGRVDGVRKERVGSEGEVGEERGWEVRKEGGERVLWHCTIIVTFTETFASLIFINFMVISNNVDLSFLKF